MKLKIAVITGGYSHEKKISFESVKTILSNLDSDKYDVYKIIIDENGWFYDDNQQLKEVNRSNFSIEVNQETIVFDFAYIIIHGTPGEDGKLQAYFDMLKIPYNTPNHTASTITFNKWTCNTILRSLGFPVAPSIVLRRINELNIDVVKEQIGIPCFVKPNDGGSSFGASRVNLLENLEKAVKNAFEHGNEVIIEGLLKGTEVTCGTYSHHDKINVLPITEIVSENEFFDFQAKYEGKSKEITPARISNYSKEKITQYNTDIYKALNLKGVVRIDYIICEKEPFIIEINTTPGMSKESIIPQQARCANLPISILLDQIIETSMALNTK